MEQLGGSWWRFATRLRPGAGWGNPSGGAAPAGGVRTPALGRPWGLVRAHYEGLPSMAGREGMKESESSPDAIGPQGLVSLSPEVRVQGQKSPQVERRMASVLFAGARDRPPRRSLKTKRRSALHPLTI